MITGLGATTSASTDSLAEKKRSNSLNQDAFLKIFMAQLSHQDPLNPMEGTEFTNQLTQFSSLEQLFNVNQNLETIKGSQDTVGRFEALNFIGKEVLADGDQISLPEEGSGEGLFNLGGQADCIALITDEEGNLIRKIPLGVLQAGEHTVEWDGLSESGLRQSAGEYRFEVAAFSAAGEEVPVETMVSGRVSRVDLEEESPVVYIGDIPIDLSQIRDVRANQTAGAPTESSEY